MPVSKCKSAAGRSVLVCGLPAGTKKEVVIIHFQKQRHGGGEVDSVKMLNNDSAVVTFEEVEVARSVLNNRHEFNGASVDVKPYYEEEPGEIFKQVTASLRPEDFDVTTDYMQEVLKNVCTTINIKWRALSDRFLLSGTLEQINLARDVLRQHLVEGRDGKRKTGSCNTPPNAEESRTPPREANTVDQRRDATTTHERVREEQLSSATFKVEQHVRKLIFRTQKNKLRPMLQYVSLKETENRRSVIVKPKGNCSAAMYTKVCKRFGDLCSQVSSQMKEEAVSCVSQSEESRNALEREVMRVLKRFLVWVDVDEESSVVRIYGTSDSDVQRAKKMINHFVSSWKEDRGEENNRREKSGKGHEVQSARENGSQLGKMSINHRTATGVNIELYKGDIRSAAADVIVSGVQALSKKDTSMLAEGSLSGGRSKKGIAVDPKPLDSTISFKVPSLQMPCKSVIEAPLLEWAKVDENQSKKRLFRLVNDCIILASGHRMESIAFPPFTVKPFEFPPEVSASVQFRAIKRWSDGVGPINHGVHNVQVAVPDEFSFEKFKNIFIKLFPKAQPNGELHSKSKESVGSGEGKRSVDQGSMSHEHVAEQPNVTCDRGSSAAVPPEGAKNGRSLESTKYVAEGGCATSEKQSSDQLRSENANIANGIEG